MRQPFLKAIGVICVLGACVFVLKVSPVFAVREAVGQFENANKLYRDGKFKEASEVYLKLLGGDPRASAYLYNLGNCYFRLGEMGKAIHAYESALANAPRNQDIRSNLAYVRTLLEYRMEDKRSWYIRTGEELLSYMTLDESLLVFLGVASLLLLTWVLVVFLKPGAPWGWWRKLLLLLAFVGLALYVGKYYQMQVVRVAVVIPKEAEVRYGPSLSDQIAFRLGEGLKIYVTNKRENWSRVLVPNGESGWIKNSEIAEVVS